MCPPQFAYTSLFGAYAVFIFLRTGHLASIFLVIYALLFMHLHSPAVNLPFCYCSETFVFILLLCTRHTATSHCTSTSVHRTARCPPDH
jgi:hypothetical protein